MGQFFKFKCHACKNYPKNIVVSAVCWNLFDVFLLTQQEHFVYEQKYYVMT